MTKLRNDKKTCDVTLVGSDGGIVQAHRNVLLLNSDYIREMLRRNASPNPMIGIPDINSEDLCKILDFIYLGKILVNIEEMENFIRQSKMMKVKGMLNDTYTVDMQSTENVDNHPVKADEISLEENVKEATQGNKNALVIDKKFDIEIIDVDQNEPVPRKNKPNNIQVNRYSLGKGDQGKGTLQGVPCSSSGKPPPLIYLKGEPISRDHLKIVLMKLETRHANGIYNCNKCGYAAHNTSHIREHVERHIDNLVYKCKLCSRMSNGSSAHRAHFRNGKCFKELK